MHLLPRMTAAVVAATLSVVLGAAGTALAASGPTSAMPAAAPKAASAPKPAPAAFGIQPAGASKVDARENFSYGATPGGKVSDHVALVNIGTAALTVSVYATDALSTADGNFSLAASNVKPTDAGSWIKVSAPAQVTLPPRTAKGPSVTIFPFTLTVPANASPGDHAAGVIVSLRSTAVAADDRVKQNLDQRVGARVYVRVSGPVHAGLSVDQVIASFNRDSSVANPIGTGTVDVSYRVRNTGNVILGADQVVSVSSWLGGGGRAKGLAAVPALLPGATVVIRTHVQGVLPGFKVSAHITLKPIVPVGAVDPGVTNASVAVALWLIPWALVVLVLIVGGAAGLFLVRRRRGPRRPRGGPRHTPVPVKPTIQPTPVG
jgi:hypothetical protein